MKSYIIRLDDASEYMDCAKWAKMESLLDKYSIKPIFGIIPDNQDSELVSKYDVNPDFWGKMHDWIRKGWVPAMHGYQHVYVTNDGGINPVNRKSEFAGLPYEVQAEKISKGWAILQEHDICPLIFFAPAHTFDEDTLAAIKNETPIRIVSDTPAWDVYKRGSFCFIPQQSGRVRKLPFRTVTFCYHPNTMTDADFIELDTFLRKYINKFTKDFVFQTERKRKFIDHLIWNMYFGRRK